MGSPAHTAPEPSANCAVLLHGMGRGSGSMDLIADALRAEGYLVWNEGYPSTSATIEQLAVSEIERGAGWCRDAGARRIDFVTHSLGGILVRYYLQDRRIDGLGRIVMLSPPNHGSEIADLLRDNALYQQITGPAGQELGTGAADIPRKLKPVRAEIGVIAGSSTSDPWFSPFIPGEDDGKVSVESARLDEMRDFLVVDSGHSFIMRNGTVIRQILHFLKRGVFDRIHAS